MLETFFGAFATRAGAVSAVTVAGLVAGATGLLPHRMQEGPRAPTARMRIPLPDSSQDQPGDSATEEPNTAEPVSEQRISTTGDDVRSVIDEHHGDYPLAHNRSDIAGQVQRRITHGGVYQ